MIECMNVKQETTKNIYVYIYEYIHIINFDG